MAVKYELTMTEAQARVTIAALDFWMRMRLGQWRELAELCIEYELGNAEDYCRKRDDAEQILMDARKTIMPEIPRGSSYGVYHFPETERAFNVLKAIRSCMAWHDHPEGGWTVIFDRPMAIRVSEKMPVCAAKEEKE